MIGAKLLALFVVYIFSNDSCSASGMEGHQNVHKRRFEGSGSNQPNNDENQPAGTHLFSAHTKVISRAINNKHAKYEQNANLEHINNYYEQHIAKHDRNRKSEAPPVTQDHSHFLYNQQGENPYSLLDPSSIPGHSDFDQYLNPTHHFDPNLNFDPNHNLDLSYYSHNPPSYLQQHNVPYDPSTFQNQPYDQYQHHAQNPKRN